VILGRTADSLDSLPQHLLDSNVIKMTVAQAKGLEFDDVFLWDFFNGSPAEWRPLNNYVAHLAEVEETQGARKLPAGTPLVDVSFRAYSLCSGNFSWHDVANCSHQELLGTLPAHCLSALALLNTLHKFSLHCSPSENCCSP
jgi:hypothetical protein